MLAPRTEIPTGTGLFSGITDSLYHADRTSLSSTGARKVLRSPALFKYEQDNPTGPTTALDFGRGAHTELLGVGEELVAIDAGTRTAKAYKDVHQAVRDEGKVPLLAAEVDTIREMAKVAREHPLVAEHLSDGAAEMSGYWNDPVANIRLRLRADWLTKDRDGRPLLVDYKTTVSADPDEFVRSVAKYRYHIQGAFYLDGLAALGITGATLLFIAQEKVPPYLVSVIELDCVALAEGARLARRAIDTYARCVKTDTWPGYGDEVHLISLPAWAIDDDMDM